MSIVRIVRSGLLGFLFCFAIISTQGSAAAQVLGLPKVEILYTDPEKALKDGKPVRIEREARYIAEWGVWLLTEYHLFYEGSEVMASLRTKDGKVSVAYPPMAGPLIISEPERRVLDCGMSSHYESDAAVLFDTAAKELRRIPKVTYTRNCGRTDDRMLFWLHYNTIENGTPINVVRFFDRDGKTVHQARRRQAGKVSFSYKSRLYSIAFPDPELP